MDKQELYDVVIVGGGPAGYTAALYAARAGLHTLLLERLSAGGQMTETQNIENYPGFDVGIDGFSLGDAMKRGAERYGAQTRMSEVLSLSLAEDPKRIVTDSGEISARAVILAIGAKHRHLGVPREEEYIGRGVGYCAACDGMLFRGKTVAVVGGGNSAAMDALLLSKLCKKVYLIHRRDTLRAERVYHDPLLRAENVEILWSTRVSGLVGEERLRAVTVSSEGKDTLTELPLDGLFISIGRAPVSELVRAEITLDTDGYILADEDTRTNIPGVFAAGDIRRKPFRQIVTATADGAVSAHMAELYLSGKG